MSQPPKQHFGSDNPRAVHPGSYASPYASPGGAPFILQRLPHEENMQLLHQVYLSALRRKAMQFGEVPSPNLPGPPRGAFSAGMMPPTHHEYLPSTMTGFAASRRILETPNARKDRLVLIGPLQLIRLECDRESRPGARELRRWLDENMSENLQKVHKVDAILSEVVYAVRIPMTDQNWSNYQQVLPYFPLAKALHNFLSQGELAVDRITTDHEDVNGNKTLPQLTVEGETLHFMLAAMVHVHDLGIPWDWDRIHLHPQRVPKKYGGRYDPL